MTESDGSFAAKLERALRVSEPPHTPPPVPAPWLSYPLGADGVPCGAVVEWRRTVSGDVARIAVRKAELVVGCGADVDVALPFDDVSRRHFVLRFHADGVVLLASAATFVNGRPVQEARLRVGDRIYAGAAIVTLPPPDDGLLRFAFDAAGAPRGAVLVIECRGETMRAPLRARAVNVGRRPHDASVDIAVPRAVMSRVHFVLMFGDDGTVALSDAVSCSGTFVNRARQPAGYRLRAGDVIQAGDATLRLEQEP